MASGGAWDSLGRHRRIPGGTGQLQAAHVPFGLTFSHVSGPLALSLCACAMKSLKAEFGHTPGLGHFGEFGLRAETFKEGTSTFIADTVYLLFDT